MIIAIKVIELSCMAGRFKLRLFSILQIIDTMMTNSLPYSEFVELTL